MWTKCSYTPNLYLILSFFGVILRSSVREHEESNLSDINPVGSGCRIHRLYLCRRVRPPPPEYDTKLHLMMRHQFWWFGECVEPLHCHYFQVHSDPELKYLLVLFMGQIELFNHLPNLKLFNCIQPNSNIETMYVYAKKWAWAYF